MITAIVGAQFGSEGKGNIVGRLANDYDVHVRTGSCNAGHSIQYRGKIWKMQVIPCGWINPEAICYIGRGALLSPDILYRELQDIEKTDDTIWNRVKIDYRAGLLERKHHQSEGGTEGTLHERIGSTGEGVGAARLDRIRRDPDHFNLAEDFPDSWMQDLLVDSVSELAYASQDDNVEIMLEGSQGFGLSLIHGNWPYVTSHDTNAATLFADAGLPITGRRKIILVARSYPIRVAGNSGPMIHETNWDAISLRMGKEIIERTTVTRKVRRVGAWDNDLFYRACMVNGPTSLALNFVDYLCPDDEGVTRAEELSEDTLEFIELVEETAAAATGRDVRVELVGTGGPEWEMVRR